MLTAFALLLLSAGAAQASTPFPSVASPEVAAERVRACGFDHVAVKDDSELQEDVVEVTGVSEVPEAKMRCAVQVSLDTVRYVMFPEPAGTQYWRLYNKMDAEQDHSAAVAWVQGSARDWLREHGLLAKMPVYEKGKTDDLAFARKLERLCGPKAKGAFEGDGDHVALKPPRGDFEAMESTLECLINAAMASGLPIWIVGNGYYLRK